MAVKLAFNRVEQFSNGSGVPYPGAKLFTYVGGSVNTKQTTYTESTGSIANTNPIVLDASGQLPQPIWLTTGATYKFVLAPATDTDPPTSPIWTLDGITGINDFSSSPSEWITGPAPTFVSATSFTLVGDQTSTFAKSRRIKATVTAGTVYGTIVNTAFGALTTVTVSLDSGNLDSGLSAVSYGVIAPVNPSIDADMVSRKGTAVTAAATTDIWSIAGDFVHITGNTGITSFGTAPYAGARRELIFDGTPAVTHNATTLQIRGGASITMAAGDRMIVRADTTANMIVVDVIRTSGVPVVGTQTANAVFAGPTSGAAAAPTFRAMVGAESAIVLLSSKTASASASLSFGTSDFDWTLYDEYIFKFTNLRPATDAQGLLARYSTDGGSSFLSDANYNYAYRGFTTGNTTDDAGATGAPGVLVLNSVGNSVSFLGLRGTLELFSPSTVMDHACLGRFHYFTSTSVEVKNVAGTYVGSTTAINGIQFLFQAGNITSGSIRAYGVKTS